MNSLKLLAIIAVVGAIAGFGILSNEIILHAQSITVFDSLADFEDYDCNCELEVSNCDDLSDHAKMLCGIPLP